MSTSATADTEAREAPLAGLRVLDFTRVLSGPYCTALLADLGADVVKVESPQGDEYRHVGPFRAGESALFQLVNRNKRGIVLDLKQDDGRELARQLAVRADVMVENFRPGVAGRLGIGYVDLAATNPGLVYASISGFGQSGPKSGLPAFDLVAQAVSGMMAMTGASEGPPTRLGDSLGDLSAGLFAAWSIMAALYERTRTGKGRQLDIAMVDSLVSLLPTAAAQWMFGETPPLRSGNRHPLSTPFGAFGARDGHLVICVLNAPQFARLADCMGRPDLASDPRYRSDELRTRNEPALRAVIEGWLKDIGVADAVRILSDAGVPASAIEQPADVFSSDYVAGRCLFPTVLHPTIGEMPTMEQPVHFSGLARGRQRPAPSLGQDHAEVLSAWLALPPVATAEGKAR